MDPKKLALAAAAVVVVAGGVSLLPGDTKMVTVTVRHVDGSYETTDRALVELSDGGFDVGESAGDWVSELAVADCKMGDAVFCAGKGQRAAAHRCAFPVDATCLRKSPADAAPMWRGFNVIPPGESSGNCRPAPCTILAGDRDP